MWLILSWVVKVAEMMMALGLVRLTVLWLRSPRRRVYRVRLPLSLLGLLRAN